MKIRVLLFLLIFFSEGCRTYIEKERTPPLVESLPRPNGDPWFASARRGDWNQLVELQSKLNRPWDFQHANGQTVFMIAARNGQLDLIQNLINVKVNVNVKDQYQYSALSYALHGPKSIILKKQMCLLLIQNGADPFTEDQQTLTPIQLMIELGFIECIHAIKFTNTKPCDQAQALTQIKSLVTYAEKEEEPEIVDYLKSQGCV